jgi:hypothetical protein
MAVMGAALEVRKAEMKVAAAMEMVAKVVVATAAAGRMEEVAMEEVVMEVEVAKAEAGAVRRRVGFAQRRCCPG